MSHRAFRSAQVEQMRVRVYGLDLLDGTPVLDIKPYIPYADSFPEAAAGWVDSLGTGEISPDHLPYDPPPPHLAGREEDGD